MFLLLNAVEHVIENVQYFGDTVTFRTVLWYNHTGAADECNLFFRSCN